ncbi:hypothetical protein [Streptosporangium minutum]|uniref:Uncharacterized protein n=1 Tax=Streptosporangium minutum TaxID=569862 RepID=A0A243R2I2_9ACTN|nr:hypothetical protein [Streptosporangium minutum]OUC88559.1 hypothetical protein CA984_37410 [Streptosporangium minutum]
MIRLRYALAAGAVAASALAVPVAVSAQSAGAGAVPALTSAEKPCSQYGTQQERDYCEQRLRDSGY